MSPLLRRRLSFTIGLVLLSFGAFFCFRLLRAALRPDAVYTGLLLLAIVIGLTLFNARKKLPFLPLIRAVTWLQIHIYAGWFCLFIFLLHIHLRIPSGPLEITLACVFCLVIFSGFFGLYISREMPPRMARSGEPLLYDRIPAFRRQIKQHVEELIRQAEAESESSTLSDFYVDRLRDFFTRIPSALSALGAADRGLHALLAELDALNRYLDDREKAITLELRDWIETKQNLDFQYASQRLLRLWLFVHIPSTYSLILLGIAHGIVASLYIRRW